jgi:RimJ/RimL family protein N-acetyltransferase
MESENGLAIKLMDRSWGNFFLLRSLRNADRECFIYSGRIGFWKHWKWWKRYWSNTYQLFFEVWTDGKKAGFISRSIIGPHQHEIGNLMLKEKFRRKGIMSWAVGVISSGEKHTYYARTLEENTPSRNVFIRTGFERKGVTWSPEGGYIITWMKGGGWDEDEAITLE